jgi:hypothetical protein
MITAIATIIGYICLVVITLLVVLWPLEIMNDPGFLSVTYGQFGFVWAKDERVIARLSDLRKVERQRLFINAPEWFNRYVYNFGIRD